MTLTTEQAIIEQLALGNKCKSIDYTITIDLRTKHKTEALRADFPSIMMTDGEKLYEMDARQWIDYIKQQHGNIIIIGRRGQVATLPIARKKQDLPSILAAFSR